MRCPSRRILAVIYRSCDLLLAGSYMILSHKHKFIFIKTAKTAGTSIEVFLSKHCGPSDVLTPIQPPVEGHQPRNFLGSINPIPEILERPGRIFSALRHSITSRDKYYRHMPAFEVQKRVPADVWSTYFKFCVERNPWDKVLSHYHMHAAREGGSLSFDEYLARGRFPINYFRYTDRSGQKIIVDRIVRYENLTDELSKVFSQLNIPFGGMLGVTAKSEYRTDRRPYQQVFNDNQRRIVEKAFAKEIELHGYRF
jgi:Sulfotransferase family